MADPSPNLKPTHGKNSRVRGVQGGAGDALGRVCIGRAQVSACGADLSQNPCCARGVSAWKCKSCRNPNMMVLP